MSDPKQAGVGGLGALLTAADTLQVRPPLATGCGNPRLVRLRLRQPDLACHETLPAEPAPTEAPKRKRCLDEGFSARDIDCHYWQKHALLTTMLSGFAGMLARKLETLPSGGLLSLCKVMKDTKEAQPPGALKTHKDMILLDRLILQACQAHTKLVCNELRRHKQAREAKAAQLRAV
jgi:hypothetical protein